VAFRDWLAQRTFRALELAGFPRKDLMASYGSLDASRELLEQRAEGELERMFLRHRGRVVRKWIHYLGFYDRHFAPYRGTPVKILEIGVWQGGSLELWREYFGAAAMIVGVDIDPACANRVTAPNHVKIGSQADPEFLHRVLAEMGPPDIVIDDGSHIGVHQWASFRTLFPALKSGGLYVIEDLHTAYWPGFYEGGYKRSGTAIDLVKQIIDDMHGWYHTKPRKTEAKDEITGVHLYDSLVFLEKGAKRPPGHLAVPPQTNEVDKC
jgi:cephalosporin hydroxylase